MNNFRIVAIVLTVASLNVMAASEDHTWTGVLQRVSNNKERSFIELIRVRGDTVKLVCDSPQCDPAAANKLIGHRVQVRIGTVRQPIYADGIPWAVISMTEEPNTPVRNFDFESYLAKTYVNQCSAPPGGKLVYIDDVAYYDFDQDGKEEAIVVASSCMTGTAGPDIHSVYRIISSSSAEELPTEDTKEFQGRPIYDRLVGNRNYRLYVDGDGLLVQDFYDGSGREHPLKVFFRWDGHQFKVAHVALPPIYSASFDCSKAKSENEIIICGNSELARSDTKLAKTYQDILKRSPEAKMTQLKQEQVAWVKNRDKTCIPYKGERGVDCLREQYENRQKELDSKLQKG